MKKGWYWYRSKHTEVPSGPAPEGTIYVQYPAGWIIVRVAEEPYGNYVMFHGSDIDIPLEEALTIGEFGEEIPQREV